MTVFLLLSWVALIALSYKGSLMLLERLEEL